MDESAYFWVLGTISSVLAGTWLTVWLWISRSIIRGYMRWIWRGIRRVQPTRLAGPARWAVYVFEVVATTGWKVCFAPYLAVVLFLVAPLAIGVGSIYLAAALITPVP